MVTAQVNVYHISQGAKTMAMPLCGTGGIRRATWMVLFETRIPYATSIAVWRKNVAIISTQMLIMLWSITTFHNIITWAEWVRSPYKTVRMSEWERAEPRTDFRGTSILGELEKKKWKPAKTQKSKVRLCRDPGQLQELMSQQLETECLWEAVTTVSESRNLRSGQCQQILQ